MIKRAGLVLAFVFGCASVAVAETPEERQACMDDAFKFCQEAMPDRERVFSCLVTNRRAISPLCQQTLAPYAPPEPQPKQAKSKSKSKTVAKKGNGAPKSANPRSATKGPVDLNPR